MHAMNRWGRCAVAALAWVASWPMLAQVPGGQVFRGNFENVADAPASDAEAARFLTQATFGPTRAEIARLRGIGYDQWLDQQLDMPATLTRPWLDQLAANPEFSLNSGHRVDRFWTQAVFGQDQLRQRMAFALSQILVVADSGGIDTRMIAEYADLLTRGAFSSYRSLLGQVTFSPTMGQWLTYVRNRAAYASGGSIVLPDENYAREIMQLFSFGLVKRNLDFSLQLTGGQPTPTYDNTIIGELARVFTGLSYGRTNFAGATFGNNTNVDFMLPMMCFPMVSASNTNYSANGVTYHDNAAKTIFDGIVLTAVGNNAAGCNQDINAALDRIFNHATVAPFISRQLIQRFVTSNPSGAYIQRVATVFNNNGAGVRGDLGAVIRAVLMDSEARNSPSGNFGKLREPVLRMSALWRGLDVVQGQPVPAGSSDVGNISMTLGFDSSFGQRPYNSPTVFNFYEPDFQNPGPLQNANLFSPEFQILNESSVSRMNNTIQNRVADTGWFTVAGIYTCGAATRPCVQYDSYMTIIQTANATTYGQLIDELGLRLMYGGMSSNMRSTLLTMLTSQATPTTNDQRRDRIRDVIRVIVMSPEFAVQR
ncbi:MAG: hypothetical protein OMOMHJEC_01077 [Xanthomonadales bacterium]|nr:hypothetical protein [Xanthomonadales bacterium]